MCFNLHSVIYLLLHKIKLLINLYVVSMSQLLEIYFAFELYFALIYTCARKQLFIISLKCLVEVDYYLKQVFNLLYDNSVTPAEELLYISSVL